MMNSELRGLAKALSDSFAICNKEVLTMEEAVRYTGLKKSALYKLTSTRQIPYSKPNGKSCFFRRRELEDWLMSNPIATEMDLDTKVVIHCMKKKK